jgi:hypothetical protein
MKDSKQEELIEEEGRWVESQILLPARTLIHSKRRSEGNPRSLI